MIDGRGCICLSAKIEGDSSDASLGTLLGYRCVHHKEQVQHVRATHAASCVCVGMLLLVQMLSDSDGSKHVSYISDEIGMLFMPHMLYAPHMYACVAVAHLHTHKAADNAASVLASHAWGMCVTHVCQQLGPRPVGSLS
jgi:hypothetical protein